ncbi:1-acyl-sn-glycerol-3-phosphate acyltransferase [Antricoccus suffuscus]|uniref:1-acyl-sn-glycerol-3-phosphate acyltransferase n=1 Tax=Antricoccus suffuscus TaxID=1629062 RepID=A0A2T0Z8V6_9ACTN|nr:lysophospholipid acyltransferase family protein [Antricoccus suffuscus]PRZ32770.1 1-acyl-sn-glycerol-3-phosphate acyltransferase [Antricoccus suffuscus]
MAISVTTCPDLCARQGTTKRHEVAAFAVWVRLAALVSRVLIGAMVIFALLALARVIPVTRRLVSTYMRHLYKTLLKTCRVKVAVDGPRTTFAAPGTPVLVVANHVSWLDVIVLGSLQSVTMISKAEVEHWPLIGAIAAKLGTIFLDRTSYDDVARTRVVAGHALRGGALVATFPEGTTTCGRGLGDFRSAMFQAAADTGTPVRPVALSFLDRDAKLTTAASFIGDMSLWDSIRSVLGQREMTVRVSIRPLIMPTQVRPIGSRKALRQAAVDSIGEALAPYVDPYAEHRRPSTCQARPIVVPERDDLVAELELPSTLIG